MIDQLTETYTDYLQGSYDCPNRIVVNGYHCLAYTGGGFRHWRRRLYGTDENLQEAYFRIFGYKCRSPGQMGKCDIVKVAEQSLKSD